MQVLILLLPRRMQRGLNILESDNIPKLGERVKKHL